MRSRGLSHFKPSGCALETTLLSIGLTIRPSTQRHGGPASRPISGQQMNAGSFSPNARQRSSYVMGRNCPLVDGQMSGSRKDWRLADEHSSQATASVIT